MTTLTPPRPAPSAPPRPARPPARKQAPWERPEAKAAASDDIATICLLAVTIAAGLGFARLFTNLRFLPYVIGAAVLGHGTAWILRRTGVGLTGASFAAVICSGVYAVWLAAPQHTTLGLITPSTLGQVGADLAGAREVFRSSLAPVAPIPGFLIAASFGVALVAFLADWAAFRMRATFEAVVPAFAIFVITVIFGTPSYRTGTVAVLAATSLLFLIVQRAALDAERGTWFGNRSVGALPSLLTTGAVLGAVALLAGLVIGPRLPGATSKALVPWRGEGPGNGNRSRSTISPLVDIRGRLVSPSDAEVFRVKAQKESYWRLTSLDTFDGNIWSSNEKYRQVKGALAPDAALVGRSVVQEVTISTLSSIWLPAAFRPQKVEGAKGISYSERSASLISRDETSDGISYKITSVVPGPTPAVLRAAPPTVPGASGLGEEAEGLLSKPRVDRRVQDLLNRVTGSQRTSYDKAKALQDHLRTFTYDLNVSPGHSNDALRTFLLVNRRGYCEQFAGAFAVLARLLGLPSRVAVGFQPGLVGADGTFQVRDKDAHAWPEVYFEGYGWVPFEPTPSDGGSDGNPDAEAATNIPYRPATNTDPGAGPTGAAPAAPAGEAAPTTTTTAPQDAAAANALQQDQRSSSRGLLRVFLGLLAVIVLVGGGITACWAIAEQHRRRRRSAASTTAQRVALSWEQAEEALGLSRVVRRSTMTVNEWLDRLGRPAGGAAAAGVERGSSAHAALVRLGGTVVDAAYAGPTVSEQAAVQAEEDARTVVTAAHLAAGTWTVARWHLDPRPAVVSWRYRRAATREPEIRTA